MQDQAGGGSLTGSLTERISALRVEADAFLDDKASQLSASTPDVPLHVLRNLLTSRTYGCQCKAVLNNSADHVRAD